MNSRNLRDEQKNAIKAIEYRLDSAIQLKDEKRKQQLLKEALIWTRRLLPANQWGENSLKRYIEHPEGKAHISKANFHQYNRIHLRRDQTQLRTAEEEGSGKQ